MNKPYTDQPIFDAIAAATVLDRDRIIISPAKFIETFNNHRDRALCPSLTPQPDPSLREEIARAAEQIKRYAELGTSTGPIFLHAIIRHADAILALLHREGEP